jgi:WD40 repeat protein
MNTKYRAFISYSHSDTRWAEWLHRSLEGYKVPASLVGLKNEAGERIEVRLGKVFRDRDEFKSGSDLAEAIRGALADSQCLIAVCSPKAARSEYVNQEILEFKRLGRADRIHALIVDGQPHASKVFGDERQECLPGALRFALDERGGLSDRPAAEVLAPDARPGKDGRTRALIKLISGLLHIDFDALYRRERRRRQRRWAVASTMVSAVITTFAALGWLSYENSRKADQERLRNAHEAYATDLALAEESRHSGDPAKAIELLSKQRPQGAAYDVREFAWRFLWRLYDSHRHVIFVSGATTGLDISPDGKTLAVTNGTSLVTLWDIETGLEVGRINDPTSGRLDAAIFVAGGARIATGGGGRLQLWERDTLRAFGTPIEANLKGALSRDRRTLLAADAKGQWRLIDASSGRETPIDRADELGWVANYAISASGTVVALRDNNRMVVLDAETGRRTHSRIFPKDWEFKDIAFASEDALVVVGVSGGSYEIAIWDIAHDLERWRQRGPEAAGREFVSVAASRDGDKVALLVGQSTIVSPEQQSELVVWDAKTGRKSYALGADDTGFVTSMAFSPTADVLATGSRDHHLRLWEASTGKPRNLLGVHHGSSMRDGEERNVHKDDKTLLSSSSVSGAGISNLLFSPDGNTIVTANAELGAVRIWDANVEPDVQILPSKADHQSAVAFSPDGRLVATGDRSGVVTTWESAKGSLLRRVAAHGGSIDRLAFSATGETFASASDDGVVKLWRTADFATADRGTANAGPITTLTGIAGATHALTVSADRLVRLSSPHRPDRIAEAGPWVFAATAWNLRGAGGQMVREFNAHQVALAADGGKLAFLEGAAGDQGACRWTVWSPMTGDSEALPWDSGPCFRLRVQQAALSPDGKLLALGGPSVGRDAAGSGGDLSGIRIFDLGSGGERRPLRIPLNPSGLRGMAFSPDGRTLAALGSLAGADGEIVYREQPALTLWDVSTSDKKMGLPVPANICGSGSGGRCIRIAEFAPDGHALAVIVAPTPQARKSEVIVWRLDDQQTERFDVRDLVDAAAISPAGDRLATLIASRDHGEPAILWERKTARQVAALGSYESRISTALRTSDGRILAQTVEFPATGGVASKVWDLHGGDVLASGFDPRDGGLRMTDVSSDGRLVAGMDEAGSVIVRETRSGRMLASFDAKMALGDRPSSPGLIRTWAQPLLMFGAGGRRLATVGVTQIALWDVESGKALRRLAGGAPTAFPSNVLAATVGCRTITVYDTTSGRPISNVANANSCSDAVAVSANGAELLSIRLITFLKPVSEAKVLFALAGGASVLEGYADDGRPTGAFSPDGKTLATGGPNGTASLWDPLTGRRLLSFPVAKEQVSSVRFSDDGSALVVGHIKELRIWQAAKTAAGAVP